MGRDAVGWDGMQWDGVGWDEMECAVLCYGLLVWYNAVWCGVVDARCGAVLFCAVLCYALK